MEKNSLVEVVELKVFIQEIELVKEVSFSLHSGKTLCLVGESGSGKTTTAMAIMGLTAKKRGFRVSGKVLFSGHNLLGMSDRRLRKYRGPHLAMIFQDPSSSLNPVYSIGEQISEMFHLHTKLTPEEAEVKTIEALESVGLGGILDPFETYPHQLSGGMKQRVMIAMALALGPEVLIADEPTSALDLTVQKEILNLLKKFSGAKLIITHDFGVVAEMADSVAVMHSGQIVEFGGVHEIFNRAAHPYTKGLLSSRPSGQNRKKMLPTVTKVAVGDKRVSLSPTHWVLES